MTTPADDRRPRRRIGLGAVIVVVIAALAVTVGIGLVRGMSAPTETVQIDPVSIDGSGPDAGVIYIHVAGAVRSPGLYRLVAQARVVDAIAAAGGFTAEADESAVNLARPVTDGEQVVVPVEGAAPAEGPVGDGRINLNTASAAELDELPRIGDALAQRIIQWRETNGRFTSVEDLLAVPGIGEKMLELSGPW